MSRSLCNIFRVVTTIYFLLTLLTEKNEKYFIFIDMLLLTRCVKHLSRAV